MPDLSDQNAQKIIEELRKSLAWSDLVLANLNEGVVVIEKDSKIIFVNDFFANFIGNQRIFLLGQLLWAVLPISQNGKLKSLDSSIQTFTPEDVKQLNGVYDVTLKDKSYIVEITFIILEKFEQFIIVIRDITEQRKQETEFNLRNKDLESMNQSMVGRELKMIELKKEIEELRKKSH